MSVQRLVMNVFVAVTIPLLSVGLETCRDTQWIMLIDLHETVLLMSEYDLRQPPPNKWIPIRLHSKRLHMSWPPNRYSTSELRSAFIDILNESFVFGEKILLSEADRNRTPVLAYGKKFQKHINETADLHVLLDEIKTNISESEFDQTLSESAIERVKIISSEEEARYTWLSINSLIGGLQERNDSKDFVIIKGDEYSSQIALRPQTFDDIRDAEFDENSLWYPPSLDETTPGVFVKAFDGHGLLGILMKYLDAYEDCYGKPPCSNKTYNSPCLHPNHSTSISKSGYHIPVSGRALREGEDRYQLCLDKGIQILPRENVLPNNESELIVDSHQPIILNGVLFRELADILSSGGHVNWTFANIDSRSVKCDSHRFATLTQLETSARRLCSDIPTASYRYTKFSCILNTYVVAMLRNQYKFRNDTIFYFCDILVVTEGPNYRQYLPGDWRGGVLTFAAMAVDKTSG